jgi:divalent metal cation (Fe/Co/Zn/Cd) transporter
MAPPRPRATREQRMPIISGILAFVLLLVVLQLWLLTATMNAYLGGDESVIWPAAAASLVCLALNAGLLRYLRRLEHPARRP